MSEFMEKFSRRLRRALKVLGNTRGEDYAFSATLPLDDYLLDRGFTKDGDEIVTLWKSEPGWRRSHIVYSEFDGKPDFRNENWEHLVAVSAQLQKRLLLDELADAGG